MFNRIATSLLRISSICIAVAGCAPGGAELADERAAHELDDLEECPKALTSPQGHDVWNLYAQGTTYRNEAFVLEASAGLAASDADRSCFRPWTVFLWRAGQSGLGATTFAPMIEAGLDPNLTDFDTHPLCEGCTGMQTGMTTLHYATRDNTFYPSTAQGIATYAERETMVRVLLEHGADPNAVCAGATWTGGNSIGAVEIGGATPLMFVAAWNDHEAALETADLLLDAGTNPNTRVWSPVRGTLGAEEIREGDTALSTARRNGDVALVDRLLSAGAVDWDLDAEVRASEATTPEEVATIVATKTVDPERIWTLWFALREPARGSIDVLLEGGLDPNARTWGTKYMMPMASVFQTGVGAELEPTALTSLIIAGVDVNDAGTLQLPPLVAVIRRMEDTRYRQVLADLLDFGADVNATDGDGETALLRLLDKTRDPETTELLLSHGADPNAIDEAGKRPITVALGASQPPAVVDALLAYGADLNDVVDDGPVWAYTLENNQLYSGSKHPEYVTYALGRIVNDASLEIDLSSPAVERALNRADTQPLVKPFADVIRWRGAQSE